MATLDSSLGIQKGSADQMTFYQRKGKTVMRAKHNRTQNKTRSAKTLERRTRWGNLVAAWRELRDSLRETFEQEKEGQTDYNLFMSVNMPLAKVHLAEKESKARFCVADRWLVSSGSLLESIGVEMRQDWFVSSLVAPDTSCFHPLGPDSNWTYLAGLIVEANRGLLQMGDELLFVRVTQEFDTSLEKPFIRVASRRVRLGGGGPRTLGEALPGWGSCDGFSIVDGHFAAPRGKDSLVAWARLRRDRQGRLQAANQRLVGDNALLARYTGPLARDRAILSYPDIRADMAEGSGTDLERMRLAQLRAAVVPAPQFEVKAAVFPPEGGRVEGAGIYPQGAEIQLIASPAEGYRFLSWDDGDPSPARSLTLQEDKALTAVFLPAAGVTG